MSEPSEPRAGEPADRGDSPRPAGAPPSSRRDFLASVLVAGTVVPSAAGGVALGLRYVLPPSKRAVAELLVCRAEEIAPGESRIFDNVLGSRICLLRETQAPSGKENPSSVSPFRAFSLRCSHLGCFAHWEGGVRKFVCPCHNAVFDENGEVIAGPPPTGLQRLEVEVGGESHDHHSNPPSVSRLFHQRLPQAERAELDDWSRHSVHDFWVRFHRLRVGLRSIVLFQLLKIFPEHLALSLQLVMVLIMVCWPFIDGWILRRWNKPWISPCFGLAGLIVFLALTIREAVHGYVLFLTAINATPRSATNFRSAIIRRPLSSSVPWTIFWVSLSRAAKPRSAAACNATDRRSR